MKAQSPYELKSYDFRVTVRSENSAHIAEQLLFGIIDAGAARVERTGTKLDAPVLLGDTDLIPTTLRPTWTERDGVAALQEGWDIFYVDGAYFEIQRLDDPTSVGMTRDEALFKSDAEAIAHVVWHASAGSALHRKALAIMLHATNPSPAPQGGNAGPSRRIR